MIICQIFFLYRDNDIDMGYQYDRNPVLNISKPIPTKPMSFTAAFWASKGIYRVEGTPYPLKAGDILIMRPAESHYIDISSQACHPLFGKL